MSILEAVVLGIVQGLTEFLPVSSTAHLRIVPALLGWGDPGAAYSAVIQTGTLAAVCLALKSDIADLVRGCLAAVRMGRPLGTPEARLVALIGVGGLEPHDARRRARSEGAREHRRVPTGR
jgi:undecaprenyl-diphosphatase